MGTASSTGRTETPLSLPEHSLRVNDEIERPPRPRLSFTVGSYRTDVTGPAWANTLLLPGSDANSENYNSQPVRSSSSSACNVGVALPAVATGTKSLRQLVAPAPAAFMESATQPHARLL